MGQIKACIDVILPPDLRAEADRLAVQENWTNEAAAPPTRFWRPGRLLRIHCLTNDTPLAQRVFDAASTWLRYASLTFELSRDPDAEVRLGFTPGATWSTIGTDALVVPWDQATANFGWLRRLTAPQDLHAVVLHVFGHILGLTHEHQPPATAIPWDRAAVYRYYAGLATPWTPAQVDQHLFDYYSQTVTQYAAFDPNSIMILPIPEGFTLGDFQVPWVPELSTSDEAFTAEHYPAWTGHEFVATIEPDEDRGIPRNGSDATSHEAVGEGPGSTESGGVLDQPSGRGASETGSSSNTGAPTTSDDAVPKGIIQVAGLRLDVAVPEQAQVGRAFQVAVAVRQPTSPTLVAAGLPVVRSGEVQALWLDEPFLRLRIEVSAPECTFDGPNFKTFRLFPKIDSPVFYFNLTPKVIGTIHIVVNLYQEEDTLGSAGTNTLVSDQPVGDVALKLQSSAITKPTGFKTLDAELAATRGTLGGTLAQIYFTQESIGRIVNDCGLDRSRIAFDNRADNTWSSVIQEAVLQDRVEAIITLAIKEYPAAVDLQAAIAAYRQAVGG